MTVALVGTIVGIGAIVRVLAASGELWLDEIWSYRVARLLTSAAGVFTGIHSDNNHHLNTLYLRLIPEGTGSWLQYRLHAVVAGTGSIVLAALIARRAGEIAAVAAAALTAGSFLLIVYSSEARGYALAVCFAFACVLVADRFLQTRRSQWALAFAVLSILGLLSHLTFLHAFAGLVAWTTAHQWKRGGAPAAMRLFGALHVAPLVALAALYWVDLRLLTIGGGPLTTPAEIAVSAAALTLGAPDTGPLQVVAALAASIAGIVAISTMRRGGSEMWLLFAVTVFVAPAVTLVVVDSGIVYERYLLVAAAFMILSFAWPVARAARTSMAVAAALVVLFLLGNVVRTWQFIERGRGSFITATRYMTEHSTRNPITVGSDHDFRNGRVLGFYLPFVPGTDALSYYPQEGWPAGGPEWLLVHRLEAEFAPRAELTVRGGYKYTLAQSYPYAGLSGWHLALYHNARDAR